MVKEKLFSCKCKNKKTKRGESLDGRKTSKTEGINCECRFVTGEKGKPTKFGKYFKMDTVIIKKLLTKKTKY